MVSQPLVYNTIVPSTSIDRIRFYIIVEQMLCVIESLILSYVDLRLLINVYIFFQIIGTLNLSLNVS